MYFWIEYILVRQTVQCIRCVVLLDAHCSISVFTNNSLAVAGDTVHIDTITSTCLMKYQVNTN